MPQIPAPASGEKRAPGRLGGEKVPQTGLSLEDQILEDNVGLTKAVKKFDPEKGYRFSIHATWWIRQAVQQAVANDRRDKAPRLPRRVA